MARSSLKNIFRLIDAANDNISIADQFVSDLNMVIEKGHAKHARTPSQSYKPSSMLCPRNMYFQVVGAERDSEKIDNQLVGIVESGSDRHERIQAAVSAMKEFGVDCEYLDVGEYILENNIDYLDIISKSGFETKLYHRDLNISFLCDGIIKYKGNYYILEIKTETSFKWQSRREVDPSHHAQAATYSACLGIRQVLFLYENRDNCSKKAYLFEVTSDMIYDLVLSKIEISEAHIKLGTPPMIPEDLPKKA